MYERRLECDFRHVRDHTREEALRRALDLSSVGTLAANAASSLLKTLGSCNGSIQVQVAQERAPKLLREATAQAGRTPGTTGDHPAETSRQTSVASQPRHLQFHSSEANMERSCSGKAARQDAAWPSGEDPYVILAMRCSQLRNQ